MMPQHIVVTGANRLSQLIKYGLYFVVPFSVLAFGAAEDGKGQKSEIGSQRSICHRHTRTDTDICPADIAGQKQSLLRKTNPKEIKKYGY